MSTARIPIGPALRHSPIFWLGVFPAILLLWTWADSRHRLSTCVIHYEPRQREALVLRDSAVRYEVFYSTRFGQDFHPGVEDVPGPTSGFERKEIRRWVKKVEPLFPCPVYEAFHPQYDKVDPMIRRGVPFRLHTTLILPFWLILLGYLPLWITSGLWQGRQRIRRGSP